VAGQGLRRRLRMDQRPRNLRRPGPAPGVRAGLAEPRERLRRPQHRPVRDRSRHGRPDDPGPRDRGRSAAVPGPHVPGRHRRLPAVLRAGGRLRPGRHPDQGDPRRRRVDSQRPEGVDVGGPLLRHRRDHHPHDDLRRQPPPGADDVPGRHAGPRRGGTAVAPDDRRRVLQRGVLHRRAHPRTSGWPSAAAGSAAA
jgi:hypothetical protein